MIISLSLASSSLSNFMTHSFHLLSPLLPENCRLSCHKHTLFTLSDTLSCCVNLNFLPRQTIFGVVESFAKAHLEEAPTSLIPKVFSSMEVLIRACPELTKGTDTIFGLMNGIISDIEKRRRSGTEFEMRFVPVNLNFHFVA